MPIALSQVIAAELADHGSAFSARRVSPDRFGGAADPVMGFDHYRMNAVTFAPHPHAGFSAISYLFEDSPGGLRNRDSLGHDFVVEPGDILWTQAGSGVIHDELPATPGRAVHGLQIFVNLSVANKATAPRVLRLGAADIPVWTGAGDSRLRVVVGMHDGLFSPLEPTEAFNLFDIALAPGDDIALSLVSGWDMIVYAENGSVRVHTNAAEAQLASGDAVAAVAGAEGGEIRVASDDGARAVILSGRALNEPVVQYGPFIMASEAAIHEAFARYRRGDMGALAPLR